MGKSTYQEDFVAFFHHHLGFEILQDQASYDYVKAIIEPTEETQIVFSDSAAGTGKALKNGSLVQTPKGPLPIEELKVGDEVFSPDGKSYPVKGVFPQGKKRVYQVVFSDGTIIECSGDHLWTFQTKSERDKKKGHYQTKTLREIIDEVPLARPSGEYKAWNIYMPNVSPVEYEKKDLYISPYVLGVLLGDGQMRRMSISNSEEDILNKVSQELKTNGCELTEDVNENNYRITLTEKGHEEYLSRKAIKNAQKGLFKEELVNLGLFESLSYNKFIPRKYLEGSIEQRLDLLKGLIDTDGFCEKSSYEYTTSSKQLALDIKELGHSLGLTISINTKENPTYQYKGKILTGKTSYRLRIKPSKTFPKLHTSQKHEEKWKNGQSSARLTIREINELDEFAEMTCISIDSPDHLFLTENFIPTHNTSMALAAAYYRIKEGLSNKIIYVRNTLAVRENGFLPGTAEEKEYNFMFPAKESMDDIGYRLGKQDSLFGQLMNEDIMDVVSTSYLRGRDFSGDVTLVLDEAQNLDTTEIQTVLTRMHDDAKVVVIGSSLQVDNHKLKQFGPEKLTPFQLYMYHFCRQEDIPSKVIHLTKNYRGKLANYADQIGDTIDLVKSGEHLVIDADRQRL